MVFCVFRGDLEEVCKQLVIEENVSEIIEQLGGGKTGKISYEDFCRNKFILVSGINTGHTSSSESNSAPEFWTDNEGSVNRKPNNEAALPRKADNEGSKMERNGESSAFPWLSLLLLLQSWLLFLLLPL